MKQRVVVYHVVGWLLVIIYHLVDAWHSSVVNLTAQLLFQFSFCLSVIAAFYYCFSFVYPRYLKKGKVPKLVLALLLSSLVFSAVRYGLEQLIYPQLLMVGNNSLLFYLVNNLHHGIAIAVVSLAIWSAQQALNQQKENEFLRTQKQQAELAFIIAQSNPRFLLSSLNDLHAQASPLSEDLANAIHKLSQVMRYSLRQDANAKVDLQREVDYLENYIAVYKLRFGDQFFVDFKSNDDLAGKQIASLMLIPFVENAFNHGVLNDPQRPVKIQLRVIHQRLTFTVSNKVNRGPKDGFSGLGLDNTRRRLQLIYPNRHELLISDNGGSYKVTLNIDL